MAHRPLRILARLQHLCHGQHNVVALLPKRGTQLPYLLATLRVLKERGLGGINREEHRIVVETVTPKGRWQPASPWETHLILGPAGLRVRQHEREAAWHLRWDCVLPP